MVHDSRTENRDGIKARFYENIELKNELRFWVQTSFTFIFYWELVFESSI